MDTKNRMLLAGVGLILVLCFAGCTSYGKMVNASMEGDKTTVWDLEKNFQDYDVLYTGVDVAQPYGIMFHEKGDQRKLVVSKEWVPVKDQSTLKNMVEWMNIEYKDENPTLSRILGPDGHFYGYMYTPFVEVTLKKLGENELFVYDIQPPTIRGGAVGGQGPE